MNIAHLTLLGLGPVRKEQIKVTTMKLFHCGHRRRDAANHYTKGDLWHFQLTMMSIEIFKVSLIILLLSKYEFTAAQFKKLNVPTSSLK